MRQLSVAKRTTTKTSKPKNRFESPLEKTPVSADDIQQKIQETAYFLFLERGGAHGYHVEDWLAAEAIVKGE